MKKIPIAESDLGDSTFAIPCQEDTLIILRGKVTYELSYQIIGEGAQYREDEIELFLTIVDSMGMKVKYVFKFDVYDLVDLLMSDTERYARAFWNRVPKDIQKNFNDNVFIKKFWSVDDCRFVHLFHVGEHWLREDDVRLPFYYLRKHSSPSWSLSLYSGEDDYFLEEGFKNFLNNGDLMIRCENLIVDDPEVIEDGEWDCVSLDLFCVVQNFLLDFLGK